MLKTQQTKITVVFRERTHLVSQYIENEGMKKARYHEILQSDIRQFVSRSRSKTLEDMISRTRDGQEEVHRRDIWCGGFAKET